MTDCYRITFLAIDWVLLAHEGRDAPVAYCSCFMTTPTVDDLLQSTNAGCGWHDWPLEGGTIRISEGRLRKALEAAFDPSMHDWPAMVEIEDPDAEMFTILLRTVHGWTENLGGGDNRWNSKEEADKAIAELSQFWPAANLIVVANSDLVNYSLVS